MKTNRQRAISLLLGAALGVMAFGAGTMAMPVAQAQDGTSIEVKAPAGMNLDGQSISLFKVFDATWDGHSAYTYSLSDEFAAPTSPSFLAAAGTALGQTFTTVADLLGYLQPLANDSSTMFTFAKAVMDFAATNSIAPTDSWTWKAADGTGVTSVTFDGQGAGLGMGYYLVLGSVGATVLGGTGSVTSAAILLTNDTPDPFIVQLKLDMPDVDKFVYDTTLETWGKATDVNIGDTVNFKLTSKVPNMVDYTTYTFIMHDSLSAGLTIDTDSLCSIVNNFKVTIGSNDLTCGTDYKVTIDTTPPVTSTGSTDIAISFLNMKSYTTGDDITVTYDATLNSNALVSYPDDLKPNPNAVTLEYSNNPYDTNDSTNTNTTTEHDVDVYTYEMQVFKYAQGATPDDPPVALADAHFQICTTLPVNNACDAASTIKLTPPATAGDPFVVDTSGHATNTDLVSGDDGMIKIIGLDEGTYYLVETAAPEGYNPLTAPVKVLITATKSVDADNAIEEITAVSGSYYLNPMADPLPMGGAGDTLNIENNAGAHLPSTGGMGTTIFTVAGIVLILAALTFLIVRRKTGRPSVVEA